MRLLTILTALVVTLTASAQSFTAATTHNQSEHSWQVALTLTADDTDLSVVQLNANLDEGQPYLINVEAGTPLAAHTLSTNADPLLFNSLSLIAWSAEAEAIVLDGTPLLTLTLTPAPGADVSAATCQRTLTLVAPTLVRTDGTEVVLDDLEVALSHDPNGTDIASFPSVDTVSSPVYDLSGRLVAAPSTLRPGLYITRGRKVVW